MEKITKQEVKHVLSDLVMAVIIPYIDQKRDDLIKMNKTQILNDFKQYVKEH